jgi:hypothetical protein
MVLGGLEQVTPAQGSWQGSGGRTFRPVTGPVVYLAPPTYHALPAWHVPVLQVVPSSLLLIPQFPDPSHAPSWHSPTVRPPQESPAHK